MSLMNRGEHFRYPFCFDFGSEVNTSDKILLPFFRHCSLLPSLLGLRSSFSLPFALLLSLLLSTRLLLSLRSSFAPSLPPSFLLTSVPFTLFPSSFFSFSLPLVSFPYSDPPSLPSSLLPAHFRHLRHFYTFPKNLSWRDLLPLSEKNFTRF